jgi:hypothetical protein
MRAIDKFVNSLDKVLMPLITLLLILRLVVVDLFMVLDESPDGVSS